MMVHTWTMRVALLVLGELGRTALGWRDCSILPEDRWVKAAPNSLPARMLDDQKRRYTCTDERGIIRISARNYFYIYICMYMYSSSILLYTYSYVVYIYVTRCTAAVCYMCMYLVLCVHTSIVLIETKNVLVR